MGLFGFGKKKEAACCAPESKTACACRQAQGSQEAKDVRFLVLGACCKKSADTYANVQQAVEQLGLQEEVYNIGDAIEIAKYGVMQTPAFIIDNKLVSSGRLIRVEEAKRLITQVGERT